MNRPILGGFIAVVILLPIAGGGFVWWKISALKESLVQGLGHALGARVEVTSLDLDLWNRELHAAGISLVNERTDAPWEKGQISQATARFHLRDILSPTMPLTVEVSSWNVVLDSHTSAPPTEISSDPEVTASPSSAVKSSSRIRVDHLSARNGDVEIKFADGRQIVIHGVEFESSNNSADVWTTDLKTESITAGSLEAGASSMQIRGDRDKVTFSNLRMQCAQGMLTGDGSVGLTGAHEAHIALTATDIPVTMLVGVQWQMKLSGLAGGSLAYEGDDRVASAHGQIVVNRGKFNVLPWLGKVTALVGLPDISDVELDKASADYEWKDHTLFLKNLDIRKTDVTRISGDVQVDGQSQVDGRIKLGLPSSVTARWPQLQDKVFPTPFEDYNWADVHLTGTPDHLQEDLTPRLLAAGLDAGSGLLNQATQQATDLFKSFMNK